MKTRLLAIDTATEACSVALWQRDAQGAAGAVVASRHAVEPRGHTRLVLPMVQSALKDVGWTLQDLDLLVCTRGPGSFTGVRVGVSAVQGLAFALDLPVLPLSTLQVLAWQGHRQRPSVQRWQVAMDARMGEVYWAEYKVDVEATLPPALMGSEQLLRPDRMPVSTHANVGQVGTGWAIPNVAQVSHALADTLPEATALAELAGHLTTVTMENVVPAEAVQPVYLRDNVTHQGSGR